MSTESSTCSYPPLETRGLYKAVSYKYCARSGVLKVTVYCVQKVGTIQLIQLFSLTLPATLSAMPQQGGIDWYGAIDHLILEIIWASLKFFFDKPRSIGSMFELYIYIATLMVLMPAIRYICIQGIQRWLPNV